MKKHYLSNLKLILFFMILFLSNNLIAQNQSNTAKSEFWQKVQFGGGLILNFGNNFTNVGVSPTAVYNVNQYFSLGTGLQVSYAESKNVFKSMMYGGSIIALANPIESIQLSAELEQLNVNRTYANNIIPNDNFWNTGLWLGAGYRTNNFTVGARYNVLFDKNSATNIYGDALMPFVRVFF